MSHLKTWNRNCKPLFNVSYSSIATIVAILPQIVTSTRSTMDKLYITSNCFGHEFKFFRTQSTSKIPWRKWFVKYSRDLKTFKHKDIIELHMTQYKPLDVSSYIRLSKLELTKAILKIQNLDYKCIVWAILAFLHSVTLKTNRNAWRKTKNVNMCTGVDFPTPLKDINKINQQTNLLSRVRLRC